MEPAIGKYTNGNMIFIKYRNSDDEIHREDGPSYISFYYGGEIHYEYWYINGNKHREDGPAAILYDISGNISKKMWYIDDVELTEQEFLIYSRKRKLGKIF